MRLFKTPVGLVAERDAQHRSLPGLSIDDVMKAASATALLTDRWERGRPVQASATLLPPLDNQEIWAAGVTYFRSRVARMAESEAAGGGSFYDRVYDAPRPELFFKAAAPRVAPPGGGMKLRRDSRWMVPEPELVLVLNHAGRIIGYTIGNDLSARDIEGENPLYLPQAKVWNTSASVGPALYITDVPLPPSTAIALEIRREGKTVNRDATSLDKMKRTPDELASFLFSELTFPTGCLLMTGTGIVPPDQFTLEPGDEVRITIEPIGTLTNHMQ